MVVNEQQITVQEPLDHGRDPSSVQSEQDQTEGKRTGHDDGDGCVAVENAPILKFENQHGCDDCKDGCNFKREGRPDDERHSDATERNVSDTITDQRHVSNQQERAQDTGNDGDDQRSQQRPLKHRYGEEEGEGFARQVRCDVFHERSDQLVKSDAEPHHASSFGGETICEPGCSSPPQCSAAWS